MEEKPTLTVYDDEGNEVELPTRWAICWTCDGKGTTVNPSIDAHGLSSEDFAQDPDFERDYFAGVYDVPCRECKGKGKVREVDEKRCAAEEIRWNENRLRELDEIRADYAAEARMGA